MNILEKLNEIRARYDARKITGYKKGNGKRYTRVKQSPEDDGGNKGGAKKSGGGKSAGGGTRIPYGLAKGEGIDTAGMSPSEVWKALAGEGYSASDVYNAIKSGKSVRDIQENVKSKREENNVKKAEPQRRPRAMKDFLSDVGFKETGKNTYRREGKIGRDVLDGLPSGTSITIGGVGTFKKDSSDMWVPEKGNMPPYHMKASSEDLNNRIEADNKGASGCDIKLTPKGAKGQSNEGLIPMTSFPEGFAKTAEGRSAVDALRREIAQTDMDPDMKKIIENVGELVRYCSIKTGDTIFDYQSGTFGIVVPNASTATTPEKRKQKISSFIHELFHSIDKSNSYSDTFSNPTQEERALLDSFENAPLRKNTKKMHSKLSSTITTPNLNAGAELQDNLSKLGPKPIGYQQQKQWSERRKAAIDDYKRKIDQIKDIEGSALDNFLDAMSGGRLADTDPNGTFGHGTGYFKKFPDSYNIRMMEMLSTYAEMKYQGGAQIKALQDDYPEVVEMMEKKLALITKKVDEKLQKKKK